MIKQGSGCAADEGAQFFYVFGYLSQLPTSERD